MSQGFANPRHAVRTCWFLLAFAIAGAFSTSFTAPTVVQAQEAAAAGDAAETLPERQSALMWWYHALGWKYSIAFFILSTTFVALLIMCLLMAQRSAICPVALIEEFEGHLNEKQFQEAYELAKNDDSFLGQVLAAGLAKLQAGYPKAIEAMQEVAEDENMKIDHRLSYISLISSISTMMGLLGTVNGMISAFVVIANSPTTPKPSELATGISQAMVTTMVGLVLAIPSLAAFIILRNRFQRLSLEVGIASENLMSRFENAPK